MVQQQVGSGENDIEAPEIKDLLEAYEDDEYERPRHVPVMQKRLQLLY